MVSASVEQFLGKSRAELLGKDPEAIFADRPRIGKPIFEAFATHQPITQLEVASDAAGDGAGRVQISLDFIEENGERIGALLILRDSESVHRIEDELELSRRLAAVGRLTSGVAHEVKNPINAIVVHLEVLRQKLKELDPDTKRHMDVIGSEIRRLDRVVQTLVDFTRPVTLRLVETDLRRLIDEVITLAIPDAEKHGVHLVLDIGDDPLPVRIDSDLVKQAVLNVVINGMQAMSHKASGTIRVLTQALGNEAIIEIQDEGGGIPEKIRDKIFNLYFTTKAGGSGIGLPMTYRVMQLHNGAMDFDSIEDVGTTFRLRFPLVETREFVTEATDAPDSSTVEGRSA
jgi:signal transduction histidine kinase